MQTRLGAKDLLKLRAEKGFDAYVKEVAKQDGEAAARAAFTDRTAQEQADMVEKNRQHKEEWRSTPDGEAHYQATCARVLALANDHEANNSARAAG